MLKIVGLVLVTFTAAANAGILDILATLLGDGDGSEAEPCKCFVTDVAVLPPNATYNQFNFNMEIRKIRDKHYRFMDNQLQKNNCDFRDIKKSLTKIRSETSTAISILSGSCYRSLEKLTESVARYENIKLGYNAAIRETIATQSNDCANVLIDIRFLPLIFAENIQAAVRRGLKFKNCK